MSDIDKKSLTERDICTKFIVPALESATWDIQTQVREEFFFTDGQVLVRGKTARRGVRKRADLLLFYKPNIPIAVIEAKDNNHALGDGMQQALGYAQSLDVPFAFSSNGDGFLFHNKLVTSGPVESELALDAFPSPESLWRMWCDARGVTSVEQPVVSQDYFSDGSSRTPRYYQLIAINRTVEAIARGQNRVLLVMATGTGKTYTAFQIIWRLWKSKAKQRILFLADRDALITQTRNGDFRHFGNAMTRIEKRQINKAFEVYLCLYQAVSGNDEEKNVYKQFSPDFFDLIVVDECHRGSAAEDSSWREILSYFSSATQIGLTATPKETEDVSNINYFGEPVYTYSLKQGIEDGFLAPYKVVRVDIDKDLQGWRPEEGKSDKHGQVIEDRVYNQKDFDRTLVLEQRTQLVAQKVTEFLKGTNRMDKTIVFCEDIDHAERMRQALVNLNADMVSKNHKYVMRITGDNDEGKDELENFIHPEEPYPVIATTSELMTTGVDAKTCKLIVLDKRVQSMTKFKQIIGRGTRIDEELGKLYFTIMDFKKATELFADKDFDGDPVQIYAPTGDQPIVPEDGDEETPDEGDEPSDGEPAPLTSIIDPPILGGDTPIDNQTGRGITIPDPPKGPRRKYVVADVTVTVVAERVQYYGHDGKLITETLNDYTRKTVLSTFQSLDHFLQHWSTSAKKAAVLAEMSEQGILLAELAEQVGKDFDPFDLVCHIAFDQPALTRRERAANVKKRNYFTKYGDKARAVLETLLDKYAEEGIEPIESMDVLKVQPLNAFGTPIEIIKLFGTKENYLTALRELEAALYGQAQ